MKAQVGATGELRGLSLGHRVVRERNRNEQGCQGEW